jgi:perosamine synthetase
VALHLALLALGIGPGDEVLVPSLTYVASVNPIVQVGARPVFVEVDATTWQMDPRDAASKINSRTRAMMVVHLYGAPAPVQMLQALRQEHGLKMIEDCAEALGAYVGDKHVGNLGDIATYSFYGNKTITTGEGGMVVSSSAKLMEKVVRLKTQAVSPKVEYWHTELGFNYRMTNICAAIGLAQLERADELLKKKRHIATRYQQGLAHLPLQWHAEEPGTTHAYWLCCVLLEHADQRTPFRQWLTNHGIETRPFFFPAHTLPHLLQSIHLPITEDLATRGVCLPSYPDLSPDQQAYVLQAIESFPHGSPDAKAGHSNLTCGECG